MFQYNLIRDTDIDSLGQGVFGVLEKGGILCQNREMLEALKQAGARVDFTRETATFPKQMSATLLDEITRLQQPAADSARNDVYVPRPGIVPDVGDPPSAELLQGLNPQS